MLTNKTFTIIKPCAISLNYTGAIISKICDEGFKIVAMKMLSLSISQAEAFYDEHKGQVFFEKLISFMTSGPVIVAILQKENAVSEYRKLIGSTNPEIAAEGTIRKLYGTDMRRNAVHGSDSDISAARESHFFFSDIETVLLSQN